MLDMNVFGYIDPGTGSNILQILLALLVAIPFIIKTFWKKIKIFFNRFKGANRKEG